jgi:ribosomal-protein-alanine N-acetyltransferase
MIQIASMLDEDLQDVAQLDSENLSAWAILHFRQQLESPCGFHFTARLKPAGELCGFICGHHIADEAEIHKIAVTMRHRRKGIATALLYHTLQVLQDQKSTSCFLELRAANKPAEKLYSQFNFQAVGRRKKYYSSPPEDAIIMKLRFNSSRAK